MQQAVNIYVLLLGIALILIGTVELSAPLRIFKLWKQWISKRLFPLHGALLILLGIPLTMYRGPLSEIIFIIGAVLALSGPFILIYPEKIRTMFNSISEEMNDAGVRRIIYIDALLRILAGVLFVACYIA
jgi:hypothetical protein